MKLSLPQWSSVSEVDKLLFTKHLGVMLKAGITLTEAIDVIMDQTKEGTFRKVLKGLASELKNGQTLERSLNRYPKVFDALYRSIVAIGEQSGTLETNLIYLAAQQERSYSFKRKVSGAMLYPAIVLVCMLIAGSGVALFVLPQLVDLFKSLSFDLPWSTKVLLWIATLMKSYGIWIISGGLLGILGLAMLVKTKYVKPHWQMFVLHWPVFGELVRKIEMAQFCRNFGVMLKSGLPISHALESCAQASKHAVYKNYITNLAAAVDRGQSLERELTPQKYPLVPLMVTKMIGVGEHTGKLDEVLLYLADFFEEDVDSQAKNLETVIEPVLLIIIAVGVAFLAFSIITPIYKFTGSIGR